jgi:F-type H+-transporting ATPase subunit alpha
LQAGCDWIDFAVDDIQAWEAGLHKHLGSSHPDLLNNIATSKELSEDSKGKLESALEAFNRTWTA